MRSGLLSWNVDVGLRLAFINSAEQPLWQHAQLRGPQSSQLQKPVRAHGFLGSAMMPWAIES